MSIAGTNAITELWAKCKAYFQAKLVSGTNIKTVNNQSLLGSGNITISGGGGSSPDLRQQILEETLYMEDGGGAIWYDQDTYDYVLRGLLPVEHGGTGAATASANRVFAGPSSGSATAPSFRALAEADLPSAVQTKLGTIQSTSTEIRITSGNDLLRLVLTTGNNLRVDTRASTSDSWDTLYYPAVVPIDETTTANVITQTSTQSTNNPITAATYSKRYSTAMIEVKFKPAAARSANASISLGTIVSGKRPKSLAFGGSALCMGEISTAGAVTLRVRTALTANTEYTVGFTYVV